jgi:hypothetical protein
MSIIPFRPKPDACNGECYVTPMSRVYYVDGVEFDEPDSFAVIHMSKNGDSASVHRFGTETEAQAALVKIAQRYNATVLA